MIKLGKVYSKEPDTEGSELLTLDSDIVKRWQKSERVKFSKIDQSLFEKLYEILGSYGQVGGEWEKSKDEENERVFWRVEPGSETYTMLTDNIIEGSVVGLIAQFENFNILSECFETFYDLEWRRRIGDNTGLIYTK